MRVLRGAQAVRIAAPAKYVCGQTGRSAQRYNRCMDAFGIELHPTYVAVDCRNADLALWSDRSRALAVACIQQDVNRVLVDAIDCDPAGHFALRDALTALILAGVPPGFRLALVTNVSRLEAFFGILRRDLEWLSIPARCFADRGEALAWLAGPPRRTATGSSDSCCMNSSPPTAQS